MYVCVCTCKCMYAYICICVCVYVYVCVCASRLVLISICKWSQQADVRSWMRLFMFQFVLIPLGKERNCDFSLQPLVKILGQSILTFIGQRI